jgi:hypothetical protein
VSAAAGFCNRKHGMTNIGLLTLAAALAVSVPAGAQDHVGYRDFPLGASTASIVALTETRISDVTVVHERPAVMQELRWTPSSYGSVRSLRSRGDGLQLIVFSFYENQLSRLSIDYERSRTQGLTDRDMVDALSVMYGAPSSSTLTTTGDAATGNDASAARVVARWNGPGYAVALSRWAYGAAFRLTVESTQLAALARTADARAVALDIQEGPQREAARAKREQQGKADAELAARAANKATFQP